MNKFKITLTAIMFAFFSVLGTNVAQAQDIQLAANNLLNVQIGDIDIDVVDVVDVSNVLNNNDVDVIVEILKNVKIDNVLNDLLRDAEIITGNQVVVGVVVNVLGGVDQILVADKKALKDKK